MVVQMTPDILDVRRRLHWPVNPVNPMQSPWENDRFTGDDFDPVPNILGLNKGSCSETSGIKPRRFTMRPRGNS